MTQTIASEALGPPDAVVASRLEAMAGDGIRPEYIATVVGIVSMPSAAATTPSLPGRTSRPTLRWPSACYGRLPVKDGEPSLQRSFWLKTRARWSEASAPFDQHLSHEQALLA